MLFLEVATRKEAEALAPRALLIAPVRGGYMAYQTTEEINTEAERREKELDRLFRCAQDCLKKGNELWITGNKLHEKHSRLAREHWELVFPPLRGRYDENRERDIVGKVKTKRPRKKATTKKIEKRPVAVKALRVIPGGKGKKKAATAPQDARR